MNYFYTENSEKMQKMTNKKSPPQQKIPLWGGPILDLIWESPRPGGLAEIPPTGGGIYPLLFVFSLPLHTVNDLSLTSPKQKWRWEDKFNLAENATYTKIIVARLISSKPPIPPTKDGAE